MTGNKNTDKIRRVSKLSPQNNSGAIKTEEENFEFDRKIPEKRHISLEERQKIINDLRLL